MLKTINMILGKIDSVYPQSAEQAELKIIRKEAAAPAEVLAAVAQFGGGSGWLCLTDRVVAVHAGTDYATFAGSIILSGELVDGERSLHIRQAGSGWNLYDLRREEGSGMLVVREPLATIDGGTAQYEVYWKKAPNGFGFDEFRPYAGRFTGFVAGGGNQ